ncbi:uncharacterized protein LOC119660439 isoform X2 [Hermetia illucens]|nr:uncharacterized protein LOC119660439 isoform X2 [Hermetia illucens]
MFRANITFSAQDHPNESCSIIIKTLPVVDGIKKEILGNTEIDFFGTEIFMYSEVLNECAKILKNAGYHELLAAKMIYQSTEPHKVIAFEDLKKLEYFMFPRLIPNENDTAIIFSKLAQYHAATFKLATEGHKGFNRKGGIFNIGDFNVMTFFRDGFGYFKELVDTLPGFEEASEKLSKISFEKIVEKCKQSVNAPGSYNVLNHGDYHIKNMMFKGKNEVDVSEVVLVDFQICHWGSPAFDLVYMSAIIPPGMRAKAYRVYFDTFIDVLKKSDCKEPLPVFEQLLQDLKSYRQLDLFFLSTFTAMFCGDPKQMTEQMETLFEDSSPMKILYRQDNYLSYVNELLPVLLQEGVLDDLVNSD